MGSAAQTSQLTVWSPIADDEVCVAAVEVRDDLLRHGVAGDVTLQLRDALYWRHWLQVDCDNRWELR